MARWRGTTAQRGYHSVHQAERKRRVAVYRPGDPCTIGGEPLNLPPEMLDLAHDHVNGGYLPGLSCRYHNRNEGAVRGNQMRGFVPVAAGSNVTCRTCGRPYHRAARSCEVCGAHYHPSYGEQRTCGRTCGVALRRRNHGTAGSPRQPRPQCEICGKPCNGLGSRFCSKTCAGAGRTEAHSAWPSSRLQHFTCRYCGEPGVVKASAQAREVCDSRPCQLARRAANNLRVRNGMTKDDADAHAAVVVAEGLSPHMYGRWASSRSW